MLAAGCDPRFATDIERDTHRSSDFKKDIFPVHSAGTRVQVGSSLGNMKSAGSDSASICSYPSSILL